MDEMPVCATHRAWHRQSRDEVSSASQFSSRDGRNAKSGAASAFAGFSILFRFLLHANRVAIRCLGIPRRSGRGIPLSHLCYGRGFNRSQI
jgi:hypothetical protein